MTDRHFGLDLCRALAIGLVLVSHGRYFVEPVFPAASVLRIGGFLGVELFFVLSGFLIGTLLYRELVLTHRVDLKRFWTRRWLRTLPAYYAYLLLNVFAGATGLTADVPWSALPLYLSFTQNLAWPHPPFFGEAWSLSVEEMFYLLLPALALAGIAWTGSGRKGFLFAVVLIGALSFAARVVVVLVFDQAFDEGVRKVVMLRLDALMLGVLLAVACLERPAFAELGRRRVFQGLGAVLAACVVAWSLSPVAVLDTSAVSRIFLFTAASAACGVLIVVCLSWRRMAGGVVAVSVRALARWSYSAYLANLLVRQLLQPLVDRGNPAEAWLGLGLFLAGTMLLAAFTYRLIEMPFLAWRDRVAGVAGARAVPDA